MTTQRWILRWCLYVSAYIISCEYFVTKHVLDVGVIMTGGFSAGICGRHICNEILDAIVGNLPKSVFCPGFQKGRVPSEKGTLAR